MTRVSVVGAQVSDNLVRDSRLDSGRALPMRPEQLNRFWVRAHVRGSDPNAVQCVAIDAAWSSRPTEVVFSFAAMADGGVSAVHRLFASVEAPPAPRCRDWPRSPRWWFRAMSWVRSSSSPESAHELWRVDPSAMFDAQLDADRNASALTSIGSHSLQFTPPVELRSTNWVIQFGQWFYTQLDCEAGSHRG
jgi:hypothetical protein